MNLYLIKNNFKLMFRNTWSIVLMVLGPVLVIAILSSAFSELMKTYEGVDTFNVGYRLEDAEDVMEAVKTSGEEAGILFHKYPEGEVKDIMEANRLAGFVEISEGKYTVYTSDDYKVEGVSLEYFMDKVINGGTGEPADISLPVQEIEYMPAIDSVDYYGIIYIVYFCWCGMVCATGVLSDEKKYRISKRFRVACVSETQNFIGKMIPIVLTTVAGMAAATALSILVFNIHWGNAFLSMGIVFMMIVAGTAFGMMLYNITNSLVITIILQFTIVWIMGFFGGTFETYMYSSTSEILKNISPIYHGNRALVEISAMGKSEYAVSAVLYSAVITVVCSGIGILAGHIRKRGRA